MATKSLQETSDARKYAKRQYNAAAAADTAQRNAKEVAVMQRQAAAAKSSKKGR